MRLSLPSTGEDLRGLLGLGASAATGLLLGGLVARRQLRAGLAACAERDEQSREFVSVAAHELRGPIAVVHGIALTLAERAEALSPDQERQLRRALVLESSRVARLTEQLLDLSRVEAGRLPVERQLFRPRRVVEELLPRVAPEQGEAIEVRIDPGEEVVSDRPAFERVVGNLVVNALRHGRPPIRIAGCCGGDAFEVAVEDAGPGVEPAFVPLLFDRFSRASTSRGTAEGAGLGLAIALRYAEAVGGGLRYERPAPEGGARFVLSLPR